MAQFLSNLPIGAKVKFGSIYNQPIVWLVAAKNHEGYPSGAITLLTERIIKIMAVDAKEPGQSDSNRRNYGNNRYVHSNIRRWLNSSAGAGQWFQPYHISDKPPDSEGVTHNPYDQQAGFLYAFTAAEREAILQTTLTVSKSSPIGGGYETFSDKVFLLSSKETGVFDDSGIIEGTTLDLFAVGSGSDSSRICYPTAAAVANSNYSDSYLAVNKPYFWWLRTPDMWTTHLVRVIHYSGSLGHDSSAYNGTNGLRPALNLSSSLLVSDTTDADGCYTVVWWTPPNMAFDINNVKKSYDNGWCKVNGTLRQIDKVWTKVNGVLREV